MSTAVNGDPKKDDEFTAHLEHACGILEDFVSFCYRKPKGKRDVIHNLSQKVSRDGFYRVKIAIAELTKLEAKLFVRNDHCNEQGRGSLGSSITKLRTGLNAHTKEH